METRLDMHHSKFKKEVEQGRQSESIGQACSPHSDIDNEKDQLMENKQKVGVVGLGYVGLPVAIGFSEKYSVVGFDIDKQKIDFLNSHVDPTGQISSEKLREAAIEFVHEERKLKDCNYIIVAVPTPITTTKDPDLSYLKDASAIIGRNLAPQTIVVYESTVFPGATEEVCIPILEEYSKLNSGIDFFVGYSPERINPGDKEHTFKTIPKVISGQNKYALEKIYELYNEVIDANIYKAPSIKIAEASKIVENTQRDINIAFMNELSLIFDRLNIDTYDVLAASKTKWNFIPLSPGLVGGHCIGVDTYYLIHKAKLEGYYPSLLCEARKTNDFMPEYIIQSLMQLMISEKLTVQETLITILGITFKENIPDLRNSKSLEMVRKLQDLGLSLQVCDPNVSNDQLKDTDIQLKSFNRLEKSNIVILAVPHKEFKTADLNALFKKNNGILMDLKGVVPKDALCKNIQVWRL
ncbi:nucleotide sugar dehydrogenase [Siminovitchia fordii]|uniref:UDP-N-acetyl-D-galactosamine dehydrogenase n=1 Tax=Siminovitchia fordii TaxID=254759 RepID=A0ABQ4K4S4_9BACI|nr:nucleotide sugar dehydrogenase [Siminovitchia fordii]GIN19873.1 UDP-N-acetyl-D-galactosamine dehydrogenase [Siminovitchia fordii]